MKKIMRRQGDCGFIEMTAKEVKGIDFSRYKRTDNMIMALGEITGHKHVVVAQKPQDVEIFENSMERIIKVLGDNVRVYHGTEDEIKVQHEAFKQGLTPDIWKEKRMDIHIPHKPIDLPKGIHRFKKQREYDPEGNRFVED